MKFLCQEFKRSNISLMDLTPGEQDLIYDALCSYIANGCGIRQRALIRLKALFDSVLPTGIARNYNAEINTAFLIND